MVFGGGGGGRNGMWVGYLCVCVCVCVCVWLKEAWGGEVWGVSGYQLSVGLVGHPESGSYVGYACKKA